MSASAVDVPPSCNIDHLQEKADPKLWSLAHSTLSVNPALKISKTALLLDTLFAKTKLKKIALSSHLRTFIFENFSQGPAMCYDCKPTHIYLTMLSTFSFFLSHIICYLYATHNNHNA